MPPTVALRMNEALAHDGSARCSAFGPRSGQVFATGGDDGCVNVWRLGRPVALTTLTALFKRPVTAVAFNSVERYIAAGSEGGGVKVYSMGSAKVKASWGSAHRNAVTAIDWHPFSETVLATGAADCTIRLLDAGSGAELNSYAWKDSGKGSGGGAAPITCLRFAPHGKWLAAGDEKGRIMLWDLEAGKLLHVWEGPTAGGGPGHRGAVTSLNFHNEELLLVSGGEDRTLRFWSSHPRTGFAFLGGTPSDTGAVRTAAFLPPRSSSSSGAAADGAAPVAVVSTTADHLRIWSCPQPPDVPATGTGMITVEPQSVITYDVADIAWGGVSSCWVGCLAKGSSAAPTDDATAPPVHLAVCALSKAIMITYTVDLSALAPLTGNLSGLSARPSRGPVAVAVAAAPAPAATTSSGGAGNAAAASTSAAQRSSSRPHGPSSSKPVVPAPAPAEFRSPPPAAAPVPSRSASRSDSKHNDDDDSDGNVPLPSAAKAQQRAQSHRAVSPLASVAAELHSSPPVVPINLLPASPSPPRQRAAATRDEEGEEGSHTALSRAESKTSEEAEDKPTAQSGRSSSRPRAGGASAAPAVAAAGGAAAARVNPDRLSAVLQQVRSVNEMMGNLAVAPRARAKSTGAAAPSQQDSSGAAEGTVDDTAITTEPPPQPPPEESLSRILPGHDEIAEALEGGTSTEESKYDGDLFDEDDVEVEEEAEEEEEEQMEPDWANVLHLSDLLPPSMSLALQQEAEEDANDGATAEDATAQDNEEGEDSGERAGPLTTAQLEGPTPTHQGVMSSAAAAYESKEADGDAEAAVPTPPARAPVARSRTSASRPSQLMPQPLIPPPSPAGLPGPAIRHERAPGDFVPSMRDRPIGLSYEAFLPDNAATGFGQSRVQPLSATGVFFRGGPVSTADDKIIRSLMTGRDGAMQELLQRRRQLQRCSQLWARGDARGAILAAGVTNNGAVATAEVADADLLADVLVSLAGMRLGAKLAPVLGSDGSGPDALAPARHARTRELLLSIQPHPTAGTGVGPVESLGLNLDAAAALLAAAHAMLGEGKERYVHIGLLVASAAVRAFAPVLRNLRMSLARDCAGQLLLSPSEIGKLGLDPAGEDRLQRCQAVINTLEALYPRIAALSRMGAQQTGAGAAVSEQVAATATGLAMFYSSWRTTI